jgi:predicted HTH transcriptional regulator
MFADANLASPVDGRILKNFSKADLDPASIQQYRRRFEQWNPDHVWNALPEDQFLEKLNVLRKDRKTGEYGLTYAGLLMFGTYSAIMDENPNFFPDYQEIQDPKDRWVNRVCPDGNWESNLFQFYSKVLPILQNFLPRPFILEDNQRKTETPAHVAVREALANMLVHAEAWAYITAKEDGQRELLKRQFAAKYLLQSKDECRGQNREWEVGHGSYEIDDQRTLKR